MGFVIDDDAALRVFDEDGVGQVIDQRAEKVALFGDLHGAFADFIFEQFVGGLEFLFFSRKCRVRQP